MHGNVEVCCVAFDEALVLLLSGTAAYLLDLSAADHLITPCWFGMVQMVSAVVEARDVSQLRLIQRPHDVRVPQLELRPPGFEEEFNQTFYRIQTSKIDIPQLYGLGFRG